MWELIWVHSLRYLVSTLCKKAADVHKRRKKKKKKKKVMTQCCYYCNLLLALAQPRKMDGREFSLLVLCMYVDVQMMMVAVVITIIGRLPQICLGEGAKTQCSVLKWVLR